MTSVTSSERDDAAASGLSVSARRGLRIGLSVAGLAVVAVVVWWVSTHPDPLPTSDRRVTASTPVEQPVHLGVFEPGADFDRTLHVSGVRVFATSTVEVRIVPWLCRGGSVNVTTTPETFCDELVTTEGATLRAGDEIVLEVSADDPGVVEIDRVRIAYRDGFQWGVQDAGSRAQVSVLAR